MRFPRRHHYACELPGAVPIACVLFLMLYFLLANSSHLLVQGTPLSLPNAKGQALGPGLFADSVVVAMAMDSESPGGVQYWVHNRSMSASGLRAELSRLAAQARPEHGGLLLVLKADRNVTSEALARLSELAAEARVKQVWLAHRADLFDAVETGP